MEKSDFLWSISDSKMNNLKRNFAAEIDEAVSALAEFEERVKKLPPPTEDEAIDRHLERVGLELTIEEIEYERDHR